MLWHAIAGRLLNDALQRKCHRANTSSSMVRARMRECASTTRAHARYWQAASCGKIAPSIPQSIANFRNELQLASKLVLEPGGTLELMHGVEISSTSYAASAVYGRSASGPFSWQKRS
jgi:hypothetical protein